MEKGDISNTPTPRLLFVFEGLLGFPPASPASRFVSTVAHTFGRTNRELAEWDINSVMLQQLWDLFFRHGYKFDVVTFVSLDFARALYERLDQENVPVSNVLYFENPQDLARSLAVMPDVATVYDGDTQRGLVYGSKGRIVTDASRSLLD